MSLKLMELVRRFLSKFPNSWRISVFLTVLSFSLCNIACLYYGFVPKSIWFLCNISITILFLFGSVVISDNRNPKDKMGGLYDNGQLLYPPAEVSERLVNLTLDLRQGVATSWTQTEWDKTMKLMSNMMAHFSKSKIKQWSELIGVLDSVLENDEPYTLVWENKRKINTLFGYPNEPTNNDLSD